MTRRPPGRRRGAATIEAAIALPLAFVLIFAVIVGGLGVFRYQQVAALAREGSRWASLRGAVYSQESGRPPATAADVYANAIEPMAVGLDRTKITYAVTWNPDNTPPNSSVTVTVSYRWVPEFYLVGPFTLTSTSTRPVCY